MNFDPYNQWAAVADMQAAKARSEARDLASWQCQKCGAPVGWLGRALPFLHRCKPEAKE